VLFRATVTGWHYAAALLLLGADAVTYLCAQPPWPPLSKAIGRLGRAQTHRVLLDSCKARLTVLWHTVSLLQRSPLQRKAPRQVPLRVGGRVCGVG